MKTNKRTLAILTAGLLAVTPMAAGMTAFAADSITIKNVADDADGAHQYKAYCIIKGTDLKDGILKGITIGDNVVSLDALRTALQGSGVTKLSSLEDDADLQKIVEALEEVTDDADKQKIAKALNSESVLKNSPVSPVSLAQDATKKYSANVANKGWYLITDTAGTGNKVVSTNILQVLGEETVTVEPKFSLPTLTKKIIEGENRVEANTAAIGDIVHYEIKTKVPNVQGYNKYFFIVEDNLSGGLTYLGNSMNVTINGDALSPDSDSKKSTSTAGEYFIEKTGGTSGANTQIKVIFEDFLNYVKSNNLQAGDDITISYDARLNEYANIVSTGENAGNPNTANLVYSNNPNHNYTGNKDEDPDTPDSPDEPGTGDNSFVGETPEEKVNTYTTAIKIKKIDQNGQPLTGASFTLEGTKLKSVRVVTGSQFEQANDGTYWKLKNGSYTRTDPSALTDKEKEKYDSTVLKYKKIPTDATVSDAAGEPLKITATVDGDGYLTFSGLNAGTYTLKETGVPSGYNKAEDIGFTLAAEVKDKDSATWTNSSNVFDVLDSDAMFPTEIENVKGATLPSTGGMGTRLFYIVGGLLVAGSLVLLVTKKRMGAKEN